MEKKINKFLYTCRRTLL